MSKYTILTNEDTLTTFIKDNERGCFIPLDERNADYQEYLRWLIEGNETEE